MFVHRRNVLLKFLNPRFHHCNGMSANVPDYAYHEATVLAQICETVTPAEFYTAPAAARVCAVSAFLRESGDVTRDVLVAAFRAASASPADITAHMTGTLGLYLATQGAR